MWAHVMMQVACFFDSIGVLTVGNFYVNWGQVLLIETELCRAWHSYR